jgi:hypothetical protein
VTATAQGDSATKTHYVTTFGTPTGGTGNYAKLALTTGLTGSVADSFGNSVTSGITAQSCSLTAFGGTFDSAGTAISTNSVAGSGAVAPCGTNGAIASTLNYFQAGTYGTTAYVQVSMTGTFGGSSFTAVGKTTNIISSTFDTAAATAPAVSPAAGTTPAGNAAGAVTTIALTYTLTNLQVGVPVIFFGVNSTNPYSGSFVGGTGPSFHKGAVSDSANITVSTVLNTAGTLAIATATFTIDPTVTPARSVTFNVKVKAPTTAAPGTVLGPTASTGAFVTGPGTASKLIVKTYFDTGLITATSKTVSNQNIYFNIVLADYWSNPVTVSSGSQLQIALAASPSGSGTFSATSVYIASGCHDTAGTACGGLFGTILFAVSSGAALGAITMSATGFYSGSGTLTVVSANPTISVNTPSGTIGHTIYSAFAGVGYSGTAAVSAGLATAPTISAIQYTVDGGSTQSATGGTAWSFVVTLAAGLHTVVAWAKDSNGALSATNSTTLLVETSSPTITAPSTLSYGAGQSVSFTITDSLGALNAASVSVKVNGTALTAGASSGQTFTVSGTNLPGSSVTYTVTITGLAASTGHYGLTVGASNLAGNAATPVTAVVKVTVAFASSVVISGTAIQTTIGGFSGIQVSYSNGWTSSQNLIVFAVWKNAAGQTVAVSTSGLTLASGATGAAFAPLASALPTGSYTVNIFVWTTSNNSVSSTTTITASF